MDPSLQALFDRMDVDQRGPQFFSGASNITARDLSVRNAGRDMIIVNPAPISGPEASIEEVTAWLNGANFRAIYRLSLEARMDNTGTWFIATFEFGEFVRQKGTVVWATGLPGSGKTILASISIEHLEDMFSCRTDVAILYAFLRYSEKPTLLQIIAGLLTQLVSCHHIALAHLLPPYQRAKRHRDELSCSEAVKLLKGCLALFSDAFIVIDGLDEVDDTTKDGLLDVLTSLHAHILLTCRPLELFMRRHTPSALQIPVQAQTKDIEVYVSKRIKQSTRLSSILSENPDIAETFTALIQEKSKGMFLLARLQMELVLERCATIGSLLKALETLPSGINDMYRLTMDRISSLSEEEVSIAHRAFLWILHTREELSPEDLQHALTFSYQDKQFVEENSVSIPVLLSICCGLVTVEERKHEKDSCSKIDHSTQEFMKGLAFSHLPDPHDLLAVTSVACLETHLAILKAPLWRSRATLNGSRHLPALLSYALRRWGHHSKFCDDRWSLSPFIHSFLSNHSTYVVSDRYGYLSEVSPGLSVAAANDLANLISSRTLQYSPTHCTETPFHVTAKHGHAAALRALLENYSGVHVKDALGRTPLHLLAISKPNPDVARQLLYLSPSDTWRAFPSEVVDINAQDKDGHSPFYEACHYFARNSIDNFVDSSSRAWRVIHLLTSHPHIDVDLPDSERNTPFACVCFSENSGLAQVLISSIPDLKVNTRNELGETPFMRACDSFLEPVVTWFFSRDPGGSHDFLYQEDNEGKTALERIMAYEGCATKRYHKKRLFKFRESHQGWGTESIRIDQVNKILAILSKHPSHVRMTRDGHKRLPIYRIQGSGVQPQSPTVHVYLNYGHRRYEDERTSLMLLANYPATVKHLVGRNEYNPDFINAQDSDGRCALMYACFGQHPEGARLSVKILTSCPSLNVHLRDRDGMSALDYALHSKNIEALKVLLEHSSWNPPAIRNAAIVAAQEPKIRSEAIQALLRAQQVQDAFSNDPDNVTLLRAALLHRVDWKDMVEEAVDGCVFRCPSRGLFRTISVEPRHPSGFVRWFSAEEWPY
ncbi:hypothetical protein DFP72DRAFT_1090534 [Ephemerocybe angulata]|uniref:Nephrocystin 3-like N-terminal domain-containing protein n=1 Tax=Ephemerocybe angulata TaxID=980116 RepID=A0A8H6ICQ7_9AGAR|nr:hypothetical protein DFP72DRAFT_1090534 [Tulosesus angulatus]